MLAATNQRESPLPVLGLSGLAGLSVLFSLLGMFGIVFWKPSFHDFTVVILAVSVHVLLVNQVSRSRWAAVGFWVWFLVKWAGFLSLFPHPDRSGYSDLVVLFGFVVEVMFLVWVVRTLKPGERNTKMRRYLSIAACSVALLLTPTFLSFAHTFATPPTFVEAYEDDETAFEVWETSQFSTYEQTYRVKQVGPFTRYIYVSETKTGGL